VYIARSVQLEKNAALNELRHIAEVTALEAGHDPTVQPVPGPAHIEGFEWVPAASCTIDPCVPAEPSHPQIAVRPLASTLEAIEHKARRRRVMIIGEGILLFVMLGVCVVMLYRLVRQEHRNLLRMERFVSAVTHEMKTPLAGVRSLLQTLAAGRIPPEQTQRLVTLGIKETDRLEHTVENVLISGSLRTDRYELQVEPIVLRPTLNALLEHRKATLPDRPERIRMVWELSHDDVRLLADSRALRIILENLIDNALKYGASDGEITVRVHRPSGQLEISVEDTGIGFPPEHAEDLFAPFRHGLDRKDVAQHGSGLGLSIARTLARKMGGDLAANSPGPGEGSTFTVTLQDATAEDPT
jgi:signal transduction histidine kinase